MWSPAPERRLRVGGHRRARYRAADRRGRRAASRGSFKIHISGCAKGCAHPAPAALTVVGTSSGCALIANGSTRDAPFKTVATNELPAAIAKIARGLKREDDHV